MTDSPQNTVMIVDDTEANIDILMDCLSDDFEIMVAMDGESALEDIEENHPDLVLLDVMMPGMDGYEVCEKLKSDDATKDIPVIFLTALTDEQNEAKGLAVGAIDYITKPFSQDLVKARVHNHLALKNARDELKKQNEVLVENAKLKEDIEKITRHDLKTPLNGIMNFPHLVLTQATELSEPHKGYLKKTISSGRKMLSMINMSLDMYKMEQGTYQFQPTTVNILKIIREILEENQTTIDSYELEIKIEIDGKTVGDADEFSIQGEELLCYSMLANTIKNAIEASDDEETITFDLNQSNGKSIRIHNEAVVPEDIRSTFFDKYVTSGKSSGTGLGTYSTRLIAETLGGQVKLETSEDSGTSIIFKFEE